MTAPLVLCVAGARPNFMKLAPVVRALEGRARVYVLHTGQHYDDAMSGAFFRDLGLPEPDANLGVGGGTHAEQTAGVLVGAERAIADIRPDVVVVVGDVNSTLAAALAAVKLDVPVAHVEAGLRSFDRTMPEEINRVLTDAVADLCFTTSPEAADHLAAEGIAAERVRFVGNPMIDSLLASLPAARARPGGRPSGSYGVVTLHRPSNVDDPTRLADLMTTLRMASERVPLVFPVHPRTRSVLDEHGIDVGPAVELVPPTGYLEFLALVADARVVLTDSGGIQEETTVLGVPCLTLRQNTERPITITHGTNHLVGTDRATILRTLDEVLDPATPSADRRPPLWDGRAGERIADALLEFVRARAREGDAGQRPDEV